MLDAVCLSGRASRRVPSLSNSRRRRHRRRSEDLGVKVTRKKSYNVSTFQGRGPRPLPFTTYSAGPFLANHRAPNAKSVATIGQWELSRRCPTWPPGLPLAPPPARWPREARRGRGWRRRDRPPRTHPRRGPFIRPGARNKGLEAGAGAGPWPRVAWPGGGYCPRALRDRKPQGLPSALVREATASGSGRQSPRLVAGPRLGCL